MLLIYFMNNTTTAFLMHTQRVDWGTIFFRGRQVNICENDPCCLCSVKMYVQNNELFHSKRDCTKLARPKTVLFYKYIVRESALLLITNIAGLTTSIMSHFSMTYTMPFQIGHFCRE